MTPAAYSFKARYVFPIDRPPIESAWITIADGAIRQVGGEPASQREDLGDVAILPGLVNAHTHLEFSGLGQPLGEPGIRFPDWIRQVIKWRSEAAGNANVDENCTAAIEQGLGESIRGGTTAVGEIATQTEPQNIALYRGMQGVVFKEILGIAPDGEGALFHAARRFAAPVIQGEESFRAGISPHAPYTVSPRLLERLVTLSREQQLPLAMHLAETADELELLRTGTGSFVELLRELNAWHPGSLSTNAKPLDCLQRLAGAKRALVIHGNYLGDEEIEFLGRHREKMAVVYCPRTHHYFRHTKHPLRNMIDHGVCVALGTDSRGSNPDLNMLRELRFAARQHPDVAAQDILQLATINGARALGMEEQVGSLTPGKRADLIVIPLPSRRVAAPYEAMIESTCEVERVYRRGKLIFSTGDKPAATAERGTTNYGA